MSKKKTFIENETRIAGKGSDGYEYGVTTLISKGGGKSTHRLKVCETCPWRKDAEIGRFPPQAYRESASTARDAALNTFACHETGKDNPMTCAGFLRANSANNMGVRLAILKGEFNPDKLVDDVPLYRSYREMAIANGVDPHDPALKDCRDDR